MDHPQELTHISLCAGYGGIDLGLSRALGAIRTIAFSEIEAFACENLVAKMEAGWLDAAPIWTDLKTFPWEQFRGKVDILSGGFPCQPFSSAGQRAGDDDPRHLWPSIVRGIRELAYPPVVFFENVEGIISSKLKSDGWADPAGTPVLLHVLRELERLGYQATAGVFSAREIGAPHQRKRVFIMGVRSDLSDTGRALVSEMLSATERGELEHTTGTRLEGRRQAQRGARLQPITPESSTATERGDVGNGSRWGVQCSCGRGGPKQRRTQVQARKSSTAYPAPRGAEQYEWEPPRVTMGNTDLQRLHRDLDAHAAEPTEERQITHGHDAATSTQHRSTMGNAKQQRLQGAADERREPPRERLRGSATRPCGLVNAHDKGLQGTIPTMDPRGSDQAHTAPAPRPSAQQHIHRQAESSMGGDADGAPSWMDYAELCESVDNRTDELRLLGNGVVPATAERAFRVMWRELSTGS